MNCVYIVYYLLQVQTKTTRNNNNNRKRETFQKRKSFMSKQVEFNFSVFDW